MNSKIEELTQESNDKSQENERYAEDLSSSKAEFQEVLKKLQSVECLKEELKELQDKLKEKDDLMNNTFEDYKIELERKDRERNDALHDFESRTIYLSKEWKEQVEILQREVEAKERNSMMKSVLHDKEKVRLESELLDYEEKTDVIQKERANLVYLVKQAETDIMEEKVKSIQLSLLLAENEEQLNAKSIS